MFINQLPRNLLYSCIFLLVCKAGTAQQTVVVKNKLYNNVAEKYYVLVDSPQVKHGLYQALYNKKTAIASGSYNLGKKIGTWHFYSAQGKLLQHFNYDTNSLMFEAPEDSTSAIRYVFDEPFTTADTAIKPVRPGGIYYGYLPYLQQFAPPADLNGANPNLFYAVIELLISPGGRLADYKVRVLSTLYNYNKVADLDMTVLTDEEKTFIPATLNGQPVTARVYITCRILNNGSLKPVYVVDQQ